MSSSSPVYLPPISFYYALALPTADLYDECLEIGAFIPDLFRALFAVLGTLV
jgi:hypothetical protein